MKINLKKVLPSELSSYSGYRIVRIATAFYLLVMIARSSIHLFASDGGAVRSATAAAIRRAGGHGRAAGYVEPHGFSRRLEPEA